MTRPDPQEVLRKLKDPDWWLQNSLRDLYFLNRNVLTTLEDPTPGYKDLHPPTHQRLCRFVETYALPGQILLILLPRGWVKSYLITVGWMTQRMMKNWTTGRRESWIINNATLPNAIEFLGKIKFNIQYNELLRGLLRGLLPKNPETESERWTEREIQILGHRIETGSAEGNLVSRHYSGGIINDDLVNRENSQTKEQLEKVIDFWRLGQSLKMPDSIEIIPGTRWNYDDLYGFIIEEFLKVPDAKMDDYRRNPYFEWHRGRYHMFHASCWEDPVNEIGSTFPTLFSERRLKELKTEQQERFGGQYLNDPLALSQSKFKLAWLRRTWHADRLPRKRLNVLLCDPAGKDKKDSDFTALVDVDCGIDKNCYVRSAVRRRTTDLRAVEWIVETALLWRPLIIGIEENKFNVFRELSEFLIPQLIRQGKIKREQVGYARRIPRMMIELQHHSRPKALRIGNLAGYFEQGKILLAPTGMDDLRDEMLRWTPAAIRDDLADALAYILDVAVFPTEDDVQPTFEIPEELKMTMEQREKREWDSLPDLVSASSTRDGGDVDDLY